MLTYRLLGIAAVTLALAGCSAPAAVTTGAASPSPSASASGSPSATPTPDPTVAAPRADYGFTFFEDAQLGATWTEMSAQLGYPVAGLTECPWYGVLDQTDPSITWAFADSQNPAAGTTFFYSQAQPGVTSYPRNAENVGVGSTAGEVNAAYPGAVLDSMSDLGAGPIARLTVDDPASDSKYVFGFTEGSPTVDLLQWGTRAGTQWSHLCTGF